MNQSKHKKLIWCSVVGARPQFIKMAMLERAVKSYNQKKSANIKHVIVHTGQHYDFNMNDVFFKELAISKPEFNLGIKASEHMEMIGQMMEGIEGVFLKKRPDILFVYGDTNSTLAAALVAKKMMIPIVHIESGARSYDLTMPEEQNRILVDRISDFLFCASKDDVLALRKEGIPSSSYGQKVYFCGDIMYDAVKLFKTAKIKIPGPGEPIKIFMTLHRAENTDSRDRLQNLCESVKKIAETDSVRFAIHPRTLKYLKKYNINLGKIKVLEPLSYLETLSEIESSHIVLTDSGGLQKEAFYLRRPFLILRDRTEWMELVRHKYGYIAGKSPGQLFKNFKLAIKHPWVMDRQFNPFGKGKASDYIVSKMYKISRNLKGMN